ncbi:MAG: dockerin type I domain-containing protein [Planctomycetota bacterium]|nr:dockerin type I domain-containing protein [Planctomycetota bacterium]
MALITAVFFGQSAFGWQDEDGRVGLSHGRVDLSPAEDAENQDADGGAKLLQIGERSAIHVNVSGLEPGATYDVTVSSADDGGSIGSITTRDGGVSPSRCYTGRLASPEEPEVIADEPAGDGGEGEGAGEDADDGMDDEGDEEADDGRGRPDRDRGNDRNNDRHWGNDRGRSHGWNFWRPSRRASGSATIMLNRDYSEASYRVSVRRLAGEVSGIRIILSDDSVIESEDLRGTFELADGQLAAMTGGATVEVYTSGEDDEPGLALVGGVSSCFPFLDRMRERLAERRAGKGVLRFDTARDDVLPLGAESLADLVGSTMSVVDSEGGVMMSGDIGELSSARVRHPRHPGRNDRDRDDRGGDGDDDAADAGGDDAGDGVAAAFEELLELDAPELSFDVREPHNTRFLRGDSNDDGSVDISDAVAVLGYLFQGGNAPYCADAADANDDGQVDIGDPILILRSLFQRSARIRPPYPRAGHDRTPDELDCDIYEN